MRNLRFCCALLLLAAPAAFAQATRTWISGVGDDLNPCSRTAPCLTLSGVSLRGVDLRKADLRGADFTGADLCWIRPTCACS